MYIYTIDTIYIMYIYIMDTIYIYILYTMISPKWCKAAIPGVLRKPRPDRVDRGSTAADSHSPWHLVHE